MSSGTASRHQHHGHDHAHDGSHSHGGAACCGAGSASGGASSINRPPATGRSFRVTGPDCAEGVAVLNKVVGPELGGPEHLAFDVLHVRTTVLDRPAEHTSALQTLMRNSDAAFCSNNKKQ